MSEEIYGYYDDPSENETFLGVMLQNWSDDELAYMIYKVQHPSYGELSEE